MTSLIVFIASLASPGHAESFRLPTLNAYAACKYFVNENRLNCIKPGEGEPSRDWQMKIDGEANARAELMRKAMAGAGFKVHSRPPGVVVFLKSAEAAD